MIGWYWWAGMGLDGIGGLQCDWMGLDQIGLD